MPGDCRIVFCLRIDFLSFHHFFLFLLVYIMDKLMLVYEKNFELQS